MPAGFGCTVVGGYSDGLVWVLMSGYFTIFKFYVCFGVCFVVSFGFDFWVCLLLSLVSDFGLSVLLLYVWFRTDVLLFRGVCFNTFIGHLILGNWFGD